VLLDGHRVVGAALDRRVVGDDHAFTAGHPADAGDDAGGGRLVVVHAGGREAGQFEEGRAGVHERLHAVPGQQFAPVDVSLPGPLAATKSGGGGAGTQVVDERGVFLDVPLVRGVALVGPGPQDGRVHLAPLRLAIVNIVDVSGR
jgi:hypothetical protein